MIVCGPHERRLINDLMAKYKTLERPVANESDAVILKFGLTLQQIMDVVSQIYIPKTPPSPPSLSSGPGYYILQDLCISAEADLHFATKQS